MKKTLAIAGLVCAGVLVVAELAARLILGLGTPPLSVAHPTIEYMFAPDQSLYRFGNRQIFNEYGMRSDPVSTWGDRDRVLVMGDSVLNGGSLTDHSDLATTILTDDQTVYANVSAGSWGPENMLAWLNVFGLNGADRVVLVLRPLSIFDFPTFAPLDPRTHPTRPPLLALEEGIDRYLPRYLPEIFGADEIDDGAGEAAGEAAPAPDADRAVASLTALVQGIRGGGAGVCVVIHLAQSELANGLREGGSLLARSLDDLGVPAISVADQPEWQGEVAALYRDDVHLTVAGQLALSGVIRKCAAAISDRVSGR